MIRTGGVGGRATRGSEWLVEWPKAERAIHQSVRGRLPTGVEPEDVSQQVFVNLLRAGANAPPSERLTFWALAVARRVVADLYRRKPTPVLDLALAPVVDIETIALTRMRCEAAAEAYAGLRDADRESLVISDGGGRVPNHTKLRRSRARRTLREHAEKLVGAGLLLPRWGWIAGTTGVAAVIVPLCLALGGPHPDTEPDTTHGTPVDTVMTRGVANSSAGPAGPDGVPTAGEPPARPAPSPAPPEPTYHRRVSVSVPVAGTAGYDHYSPPPGSEAQPLACASNLPSGDPACVDHPLR